MKKITKSEENKLKKEPLMTTWGRILTRVIHYYDDERLKLLVTKLNQDLKYARIEENYFKQEEKTLTCPTCSREYVAEEEKEFIENVGECSACDHVRGDVYAGYV